QAHMPVGADILINKMGTASGMWFEHEGTFFVSMPGVPREMKYLMSQEVLPRLQDRFDTPTILHHTTLTTGKGETDLSGMLEEFEDNLPNHIKLAYLPKTMSGLVRLRLSARGQDKEQLEKDLQEQVQKLPQILGSLIYGEGEETLSQAVGKLLAEKNSRVGTAESCTGGNIAHQFTEVAGSSQYYEGSVIAYSNQVKINVLGVHPNTIEDHGAVSEQTVRAMAKGLMNSLGVDYAIAVSGIAGPGGGRPNKPVGTIWVAVGNKDQIFTKKLQLSKDRTRNIQLTTTIALNILRRFLLGDL
ncbi:MAG: nicotinamide-nucleotide amidohydrolase family protein, partial [Saprospiraceae bacterium]|nr:nicotinamide-nucleotide amidohydrolase family protein [Saprospiraceae bacterium]